MGLVWDKQPASRLGTVQQITTGAASVAVTNPFGAQTYQVRIAITANGCFFRVGDGTPTAVATDSFLESVRKHQAGLQSFRSMRRIEASRRNASALRLRFSQSLASLRQRLSQAKVRSTTQRRGSTTNPFVRSERLTISVSSCGKIFAKAF